LFFSQKVDSMKRKKFCPSCGRITDKLINGLCEKCYSKKFLSTLKFPERIEIEICKNCGRVRYRNKLMSLNKAIENILKKHLSLPEVESVNYRIRDGKLIISITLRETKLEKEVQLIFLKTICRECSLEFSKYYETKIQLRGKKLELILKEIETFLERLRDKERLAFISEMKELKEGIDLYIPSKSIARKIVNFLKKKYKIKTKISRTLWGLESGKRVYKDTILVRIDG